MKSRELIFSLCLMLLAPCNAVALFVWYDEDGRKHISTVPRECIVDGKVLVECQVSGEFEFGKKKRTVTKPMAEPLAKEKTGDKSISDYDLIKDIERAREERRLKDAERLNAALEDLKDINAQFPWRVTKKHFLYLYEGMTYWDAIKILGDRSGELLSSNKIGDTRTELYSWSNPDGSNMNLMFQNYRLVQKAQYGLE